MTVDKILKGACATKAERKERCRRSNLTEAGYTRDGGWPSGVALWGEAPNRRVLRWLKTVVVSDAEKAQVMRQVGTRKTVRSLDEWDRC